MPLLEIQDLTKRFGGLLALDRVSFSVGQGQIVSLIGPNGAGKTTLFNCVTGVIRSDAGTIRFSATRRGGSASAKVRWRIGGGIRPDSIEQYPAHEVATLGIARTFQNIRLFANMSVLENVLAGTYVRTTSGLIEALWPGAKGALKEERWAMDRALRLLEELELASSVDQIASALPYGQQRRLELARALASEPELLLLDEPAAGLTLKEREALMKFLLDLKKKGMTLLLIEHDMRVVMPVSDWVVVLDYGEKIAEGTPQEIQQDSRVIEAYLGREGARLKPGTPSGAG